MNYISKILSSFVLFIFTFSSFSQSVIWSENFETNGHGTRYIATSDGGFRDGTNDYFNRTDGSDINVDASSYTGFTNSFFWAAEDTDDDGGDGNKEQIIQFTGINISGYSNLTLSGLFGAGNNYGPGSSFFDKGDYIKINYSIDDSPETNGIWFSYENHGDNYNEPLSVDSDFDGNADQTDGTNRLNSSLLQYSIPISSGTILNLKIKIAADSGSEEIAVDNFILKGNLTGTQMPAIAVSLTNLSDFEYMENSGPSISQSFYINGSNLINDLIISPTTNYEISTDGINYQSTIISLTNSGGNAASTIYTRLKAGLNNGTYNNENIILSSNGAVDKSVNCDGFVTVYVVLPNAWINEFHYDNVSTDVNEFIEVVIENSSSFNLYDFTISLYNGSNGTIYDSETVDNFTHIESHQGYSFYYLPISGIQNGPDGIGLDWQGFHIQLLSYEGSFIASEGPANNKNATDILIEESTSSPVGSSLQLIGTGFNYNDFSWANGNSTPGAKSYKQLFDMPLPAVPFNYSYIFLLFFLLVLPVLNRYFL